MTKSQGPAATPPADASPTQDQTIPVVALQVVSTAPATRGKVLLEVHADGTISDGAGQAQGKNDGKRLVLGDQPLWKVENDGTVVAAMFPSAKMHFDQADALIIEQRGGSGSVTVDDSGNVVATSSKGKKDKFPWRIKGMSPRARRAAALLSMSISRPK